METLINAIKIWHKNNTATPDWSINDPSQPGYIKNRTHYIDGEVEYFYNNIISTTACEIEDFGDGNCYIIIPLGENLEEYWQTNNFLGDNGSWANSVNKEFNISINDIIIFKNGKMTHSSGSWYNHWDTPQAEQDGITVRWFNSTPYELKVYLPSNHSLLNANKYEVKMWWADSGPAIKKIDPIFLPDDFLKNTTYKSPLFITLPYDFYSGLYSPDKILKNKINHNDYTLNDPYKKYRVGDETGVDLGSFTSGSDLLEFLEQPEYENREIYINLYYENNQSKSKAVPVEFREYALQKTLHFTFKETSYSPSGYDINPLGINEIHYIFYFNFDRIIFTLDSNTVTSSGGSSPQNSYQQKLIQFNENFYSVYLQAMKESAQNGEKPFNNRYHPPYFDTGMKIIDIDTGNVAMFDKYSDLQNYIFSLRNSGVLDKTKFYVSNSFNNTNIDITKMVNCNIEIVNNERIFITFSFLLANYTEDEYDNSLYSDFSTKIDFTFDVYNENIDGTIYSSPYYSNDKCIIYEDELPTPQMLMEDDSLPRKNSILLSQDEVETSSSYIRFHSDEVPLSIFFQYIFNVGETPEISVFTLNNLITTSDYKKYIKYDMGKYSDLVALKLSFEYLDYIYDFEYIYQYFYQENAYTLKKSYNFYKKEDLTWTEF